MKEFKIETNVQCFSYDELSETYQNLVDKAKQQTKTAYAPYSKFHVGAAVLMDNGEILCGSNQENAAYPSGLCAERTTLFYANAHYPDRKVVALAIAAAQNEAFLEEPISPCGACRQVMLEYE
ncbi:MAG: cytidine deaminase, partial [Paludibacteraceae bacterium]|nr:cytidine deaminase [Paludibacteraceae bacterium]